MQYHCYFTSRTCHVTCFSQGCIRKISSYTFMYSFNFSLSVESFTLLIIPSALRPQLFPVLTMEKNLKEKQCIFAGPVAMSFCGWSLQELAVSWTLATFEYTRKTLLTNSNHLFKGANIKIFIVAWYSLSLLLQHRWHCEGWTTSNRAEFLFNL